MRISFSGLFPFISVPPDASTTSSDSTMPPRLFTTPIFSSFFFCIFILVIFVTSFFLIFIYSRAPNSDLIDHTISVSLFGWLLTWTQVLISGFWSFISMLTLFISVSCNISTAQNNTVGVQDTPPKLITTFLYTVFYGYFSPDFEFLLLIIFLPLLRPLDMDFIASLHTIYAYLTGLLLTLTGIKYQGSNTDPFSEHPTLMILFLIAVFLYIIALITLMRSSHMSDHCSMLSHGVCHICGGLACEVLLLVLVSPAKSLIINVSSLALIVTLVACYKCALHLSHEEGTEEQASQMVDLEAAATISSA